MKMLIVTAVESQSEDVIRFFRRAGIERFSGSEIEGYNSMASVMLRSDWFRAGEQAADSEMYFSFTESDRIDVLFDLLEAFNRELTTDNPIRAVVIPIERFI